MSKLNKLITTMGTEIISDDPLLHLRNILIKWFSLFVNANTFQVLFDNDKNKLTEKQKIRLFHLLDNFAINKTVNKFGNEDVIEISSLLKNNLFYKLLNPKIYKNITIYINVNNINNIKKNSYIEIFLTKPTKNFKGLKLNGDIKLISCPKNLLHNFENCMILCTNDLDYAKINIFNESKDVYLPKTYNFENSTKGDLEYYNFVFIKYWGRDGYMYYDDMLKNNAKKLSKTDKSKLDQFLSNFAVETDPEIIADQCADIGSLLSEHEFSRVLNKHSQQNKDQKYFIKNIEIGNNLENIKPNRWMSFSMLDDFKLDNLRFGNEVLIFNAKSINYVDTLNIADENEVLINSNELLPLILSNGYGYINPLNFDGIDSVQILDIFTSFLKYLKYNVDTFGDIESTCKLLNIENNKQSIEDFVKKSIPETIIYNY